MIILYAVTFPDRSVPRSLVENSWTAAGLPQPVPAVSADPVPASEVRGLVERVLAGAGAAGSTGPDGDVEFPDSALDVLGRVEEFYHRLYPETRGSADRGHFQYERLEWLGEF